jgi:hypothetical protein
MPASDFLGRKRGGVENRPARPRPLSLDIHQAVAMRGRLGVQQLGEASALSRVRRECLDGPDVGDDIDERAADVGSTVSIDAVAQSAALA